MNDHLYEKRRPRTLEPYIGKRYGNLVGVKPVSADKHSRPLILVRCDCGNEKTVRLDQVRSGLIKSCGCSQYTRKVNALPESTKSALSAFFKKQQIQVNDLTTPIGIEPRAQLPHNLNRPSSELSISQQLNPNNLAELEAAIEVDTAYDATLRGEYLSLDVEVERVLRQRMEWQRIREEKAAAKAERKQRSEELLRARRERHMTPTAHAKAELRRARNIVANPEVDDFTRAIVEALLSDASSARKAVAAAKQRERVKNVRIYEVKSRLGNLIALATIEFGRWLTLNHPELSHDSTGPSEEDTDAYYSARIEWESLTTSQHAMLVIRQTRFELDAIEGKTSPAFSAFAP